ncbi:MAG: hypothetical protein VKP70_12115 [Cyanobacteriota bacterium]|nr:hypothetical protein [Cyanobacteriota bacterium]
MLLIIGAATLASRSTNSYLTATKQSDAQAARQAAESGMNRVMGLLNPYAKFSQDPYLSFLLASKWKPGEGVSYIAIDGVDSASSGWSLTTLGRTEVENLLEKCGFSKRGQHPDQKPPDSQQTYQDVVSASIGNQGAVSRTQLFYRVTNYVPPERPAMASTVAWPDECETFTTAAGGTAQLSVEGLVVRRGRLVARYTLTRTFDVEGWPFPNLPASWLVTKPQTLIQPGPPISLRVGATGTRSGAVITPATYLNFSTSTTATSLPTEGSRPLCASCGTDNSPISLVQTGISLSDIIPAWDTDLPKFPFNTDSVPASITASHISNDNSNYPYTNNSNTALVPECAYSQNIQSGRPNEIDCWIDRIGYASISSVSWVGNSKEVTLTLSRPHQFKGGENIIVNIPTGAVQSNNKGRIVIDKAPTDTQIVYTDPSLPNSNDESINSYRIPDNLLNNAWVYLSSSASPTTKKPLDLDVNTENYPVNLIVRGNIGEPGLPVRLRHNIRLNQQFNHTATNTRFRWNRLRIFGLKPTTSACSSDQSFLLRGAASGTASSLNGAFVWLPRGQLSYGVAGDTTPMELLGSWWVCDLTTNLSQGMTFIMPLYGNPDALTPILPGGYLSATGFTPDLRFPVYPSLQRIRSAF